jgi:hypothetical protein
MPRVLRDAAAAGRIAGNRSDLWIPGALAALAFVGWLPFVLAVVPLPSAADLAFFGADLYTSSRWPLNAVQLVGGIGLLVAGASALVALGEAALLRRLDAGVHPRRLADDAARLWTIQLVAALPALVAVALLIAALVAVAPAEYQSPDIGGSLGLRIARDVAPFAVLLLAALLFGQALGAAATRRVLHAPHLGVRRALGAGWRDMRRGANRVTTLAVASVLALAAALALAYLLLRILWSPVSLQLGEGQLGGPQTLLLLVGFVAIWLCLLIGIGALHVWASAWWTLALEPERPERTEPARSVEGMGQA